VIYVGHIPHGFYEEEMKGFFSQFGDINKIRLSRSKRSGRSRGYAFIEFSNQDVATIVAETMNNYMMCGRLLKCQLMKSESVHPETFKGANRKFRKINWRELAKKQANAPKTDQENTKVVNKLIKAENVRRKKLQKLGIDYQFPGYV
ncbi:uncharacterized protein TRIADDRAFT_6541, partial [Trichoplax adhaerens]